MNITDTQARHLKIIEALKKRLSKTNKEISALDLEISNLKKTKKRGDKQVCGLVKRRQGARSCAHELSVEIKAHARRLSKEDDTTWIHMSAARIPIFTRVKYDEGSNAFDNAVAACEAGR